MKRILLLALLCTIPSFAQDAGILRGSVQDTSTGKALQYASVRVEGRQVPDKLSVPCPVSFQRTGHFDLRLGVCARVAALRAPLLFVQGRLILSSRGAYNYEYCISPEPLLFFGGGVG